jgi:hypothetical protein
MTTKRIAIAALAVSAVAGALFLAACGGGGSTSGTAQTHSDNRGVEEAAHIRALSFTRDKRAGVYVTFGREASEAERRAASKILRKNMEGRQDANFATQCATLSPDALETVVNPEGIPKLRRELGPGACPRKLKALASPLSTSKAIRRNTMAGPIDALRIQGRKGYALFHGKGGKDFAMVMERVNGFWRVGALVTTELN